MSLLSSFTFVSRPTLYASLAGALLISLANVPVVSAIDAADHGEDHLARLHALGTKVGHTTFIDVDSHPFEEAVHNATVSHDQAFFESLHADTIMLKVGPKSVDGITKAIRFADEGAHVQLALTTNHLTDEIRRALTHAPAAGGSLKVSLSFRASGPIVRAGNPVITRADLEEVMQSSNIEGLDISYGDLTEENAGILARLLRRNDRLRSLDLSGTQIGINGLKALATSLADNDTLHTLNLSGNKIGDEDAEVLGNVLPSNTTLHTLGLEINQIGPDGVSFIARGLRDNTALQELNLFFNQSGDVGVAALTDALTTNRSLRKLNLINNGVGDGGAAALGNVLGTNPVLQALFLDNNSIGPKGAEAFARGLRENATFEELGLGNAPMPYLPTNKIGDTGGARAFADLFRINKHLRILRLDANGIGNTGADAIRLALPENATLQQLSLGKNEISAETQTALEALNTPSRTISFPRF